MQCVRTQACMHIVQHGRTNNAMESQSDSLGPVELQALACARPAHLPMPAHELSAPSAPLPCSIARLPVSQAEVSLMQSLARSQKA